MSSKYADLISNAGRFLDLATKIIRAAKKFNLSDTEFAKLFTEEGERAIEQMVLSFKRDAGGVDDLVPLYVNYETAFEQAIIEGAFGWKDEEIVSKNFPNQSHEKGDAMLNARLFNFGRGTSSKDVVKEMEKDGFRPATLRELVAFAEKFPDEQRKYVIVGLGSVVGRDGDRRVPCLGLHGYRRRLGLGWWSSGWSGHFRFLAVSN